MKSRQLIGMVLMAMSTMASSQEQVTAPAGTSSAAPAESGNASSRLATSNASKLNLDQLEKRAISVGTLIEQSSAAKQIESSGDVRAVEKREKAREMYRAAQDALKSGDLSNASLLLSKASMAMFEAVRVAAPEQVTAQKVKADFNARLETVKAMLTAHNRVAEEKSSAQGAETTRTIEKSMAEANRLAADGKYDEGRKVLDRAYLITKTALTNLRDGDTLVRSLHFASKEEEYRYEIDRNDTHQMLIQVLLGEKRESAGTDAMVNNYLAKAKEIRVRAEEAASRKDYESAVKLLEESTSEVVRAIRNAGIYIPG